MNKFKMPDITLAQILAGLTWIAGQATTMGLADQEQTKFAMSISTTALTAAWVVGDAVIRHGRSKIAAAQVAAGTTEPLPTVPSA